MTTSFELASSNVYQPWNIDQVGDPYSVYNSTNRTLPVRSAPAAPESTTRQDSTNLSGTSVLLAAAIAQVDARTERIDALRQSIEAGTYHVSSDQLADSLLSSLL